MPAEEILKTAFEIIDAGAKAEIAAENHGLGMAYAIPQGSAESVGGDYGPWVDAAVKQSFYQQSAVVGEVLADLQLILTWRCSEARQFIIDAYLEMQGEVAPGCDVKATIRFRQPDYLDKAYESFLIPFTVEVRFKPTIGNLKVFRSAGQIKSDGTGAFPPFQ